MRFTFVCFLLFTVSQLWAQTYFQQEVNYHIDVTLNDKKHALSAFASFEYTNNSPDTLEFIYFHLWPNAYKTDGTAMAKQLVEDGDLTFFLAPDEIRGYIDSLNFKAAGNTLQWKYDVSNIDICKVYLEKPLQPGEQITITTPFYVKLPKGIFSRLGHIEQSYQITQWYPKPAVYDNNGWHPMPYLSQGEFYSEFGTFNVSITLPKNYVVGATGDLVDGEAELQWLEEKAAQTPTTYSNDMSFPPSNDTLKTLHYQQSNVHDFGWFADKRYHVKKGEVALPHSNRKVTTWIMYTNNEATLWNDAIPYVNDAIYYYSLWNGDYPYNHMTAVDGALSAGGGMEYPNVTVIGPSGTAFNLETVIMHEVGHNWFYGILGSNERDHPWMDEGLNSFNENRYIETKHPDVNILGEKTPSGLKLFGIDEFKHKSQYEFGYWLNARRNIDQPIEYHSANYTPFNYGGIVYFKTAIAFDYMMAYLGEQQLDGIMQHYFNTWKFKHPQPNDLRKIFEEKTSKNLDWFFNDLIGTTKKLDYKIKPGKGHHAVTVSNVGDISGPYSLSGMQGDSATTTIWYEGHTGSKTIDFPGNFDRIRIDAQLDLPESNRKNNTLKLKGPLKRMEPIRLQFLGGLENPDRSTLYYAPIMGWNNYNHFMGGALLHNVTVPRKTFEYALTPMYSFSAEQLVGFGQLSWFLSSNKGRTFQSIEPTINVKRFNYSNDEFSNGVFTKVTPEITFNFKKKNLRSTRQSSLQLRSINIEQRLKSRCLLGPCSEGYSIITATQNFNEINYRFVNNRTLSPFNFKVQVQQGKNFEKASLTVNYYLRIDDVTDAIKLRFFAGKFIRNKTYSLYNWRMDGQRGYYDYTYDGNFLGRYEPLGDKNLLAQQFVENHGAFKVPTANGQSNDWITALNIKVEPPFPLPIGFFYDVGVNPVTIISANTGNQIEETRSNYDGGVYLHLAKGMVNIYFPFLYSKDIRTELDANAISFGETIRFTLNLYRLNPIEAIRNIDF